jgi:hypothetical protein
MDSASTTSAARLDYDSGRAFGGLGEAARRRLAA